MTVQNNKSALVFSACLLNCTYTFLQTKNIPIVYSPIFESLI